MLFENYAYEHPNDVFLLPLEWLSAGGITIGLLVSTCAFCTQTTTTYIDVSPLRSFVFRQSKQCDFVSRVRQLQLQCRAEDELRWWV